MQLEDTVFSLAELDLEPSIIIEVLSWEISKAFRCILKVCHTKKSVIGLIILLQ